MTVGACERSSGTHTAPAPSPVPEQADEPGDAWRFRPTFEQNLPPGVIGAPLLEAAMPDHAQVRIIAAVFRPDDEASLGIEVWTYDQRNAANVLERLGSPEPVLRLDPGLPPSAALPVLRRQLAAPGTKVIRPLGLSVDDPTSPAGPLTALQTAARTLQDPRVDAQARVDAVARLVRGLDDALVLERDAVGHVAHALAGEGPWVIEREQTSSARRRQLHVRTAAGERVTTWLKKQDGWVLAEISEPADTASLATD